jgi:predicted anti-sigma-YlaC factor YlaD
MDCKIVQHNLFAYLEDELSPDIKRDFETHISECESCKKLLADFQSVETIIGKSKASEPNPFISTRIIQFIEDKLLSKRRKSIVILRPILVTLTVAGAIVLGFTIGKSGYERINGNNEYTNQIENLKTELHITEFIDESNTILVNE